MAVYKACFIPLPSDPTKYAGFNHRIGHGPGIELYFIKKLRMFRKNDMTSDSACFSPPLYIYTPRSVDI